MSVIHLRGISLLNLFRRWLGKMERWIIVWDSRPGVIRVMNVYVDNTFNLKGYNLASKDVFVSKKHAHRVALRLEREFGVLYDIDWSGIHGRVLD